MSLPLKDGSHKNWRVILGWVPYHFANLAGKEFVIEEKLIRGPGRSITNEKLFEFTTVEPEAE